MYFEQHFDLTKTQPWLAQRDARLFHLFLHALASVLHERERLNRFTIKHRTYQRTGVFLSFAAKKAMSDDAPLATVKRAFPQQETFAQMSASLAGDIGEAKSDKPSHIDRELSVLLKLSIPIRCTRARSSRTSARSRSTPPIITSSSTATARCSRHSARSRRRRLSSRIASRSGRCSRCATRSTSASKMACTAPFALALLKQRVEDPASWLS